MLQYSRFLLLLLLAGIGQNAVAQFSNLIIFTQANEPFRVHLNGIQQNQVAGTIIKITGLKSQVYKVKIVFEKKELPEITRSWFFGREIEQTGEVKWDHTGIGHLEMLNSVPLKEASGEVAGQNTYVFTTVPRFASTTFSETATTASGTVAGGTSVPAKAIQSPSNAGFQGNDVKNKTMNYNEDADRGEYSGPRGCPRPMSQNAFIEALETISSKTFASSKLTIAKQFAGANCLKCKQVKDIMKLFTFESDKVEFAKYAYKYTWDINNYFLLNDAFEFESSIDELKRYINGK